MVPYEPWTLRLHWRRRSLRINDPGIVTFAASLGAAWHLLNSDGFFFNRAALAQITAQHFTPSLASLSAEEVDGLLGRSDVTLIDARFQEDYDRGHLKGAINLPVVGPFPAVLGRSPHACTRYACRA